MPAESRTSHTSQELILRHRLDVSPHNRSSELVGSDDLRSHTILSGSTF